MVTGMRGGVADYLKRSRTGASREMDTAFSGGTSTLVDGRQYLKEHAGNYSYARRTAVMVLTSRRFDIIMGMFIVVNIILLVVESDKGAEDLPVPVWVNTMNYLLLGIYVLELLVAAFAYRSMFFNETTNILDLIIIGADVVLVVCSFFLGDLPSISLFRIFRLARVFRAFRILVMFPELHLMVHGLAAALKAIFWGILLVLVVLIVWSIIAVQVIHPLNKEIVEETFDYKDCDRCARAFQSVGQSVLTFIQQILAGDSWGQVSVPIIERHPWTAVFFTAVLVSVNLAILNLILAVIVESAQEARQNDLHTLAVARDRAFVEAKRRLVELCETMDVDMSGCLSLDELLQGYDNVAEFRDLLTMMDLKKKDMSIVFHILDEDKSGTVQYAEFAEQLHKMKNEDMHTLLVFVKFYVSEIRVNVHDQLTLLKYEVAKKLDMLNGSWAGMQRPEACSDFNTKVDNQVDNGEALASSAALWSEEVVSLSQQLSQTQELNHELLRVVNENTEAQAKTLTCLQNSLPRLLQDQVPGAGHNCFALENTLSDGGNHPESSHTMNASPWTKPSGPVTPSLMGRCCTVHRREPAKEHSNPPPAMRRPP